MVDTLERQAEQAELDETDDAAARKLEDLSAFPDAAVEPFGSYEMGATLQDLKVSAATNGNNYDLTFEVGMENIEALASAVKGGHDVTWKQIGVGAGASIRRFAVTRDADDAPHLKVSLHFPASEVKSAGRLAPLVATHGKLLLEPMQGTLSLPGGKEVDLTAKA